MNRSLGKLNLVGSKQVNIILFGAPGSGKGTQASNLVKKFNFYKLSTGDLLREEIKNETQLGRKSKVILQKGQLVSDEIVNQLIEKIVSKKVNPTQILTFQSVWDRVLRFSYQSDI